MNIELSQLSSQDAEDYLKQLVNIIEREGSASDAKKHLKKLKLLLSLASQAELTIQIMYTALFPNAEVDSAQSQFNRFKKAINQLAEDNKIPFKLEVDNRRNIALNEKACWFEGAPLTDRVITQSNATETRPLDKSVHVDLTGQVGDKPIKKVFVSYASDDKEQVRDLINRMKIYSDKKNIKLNYWFFDKDLHRGDGDTKQVILKNLDDSQAVLFLISPSFTSSDFIKEEELPRGLAKIHIPCPILKTQGELLEDHSNEFVRELAGKWRGLEDYSSQQTKDNKNTFASELVDDIIRSLDSNEPPPSKGVKHLFEKGVETGTPLKASAQQGLGTSNDNNVDVQTILFDWYSDNEQADSLKKLYESNKDEQTARLEKLDEAGQDNAPKQWPQLVALLGDYGAGKTWSCMKLVQTIEGKIAKGEALKKPLMLNLKRINDQDKIQENYTLEEVLKYCLHADNQQIDITVMLNAIKAGNYVLIFDGLDEVLVHLSPGRASTFITQLMRFTQGTNAKMLLACRTHYFEHSEAQNNFLIEDDRGAVSKQDYFNLNLKPLTWEQIEDYCQHNLPGISFESFKSMIQSMHNLEEMITKPYHLRLVSEQISHLQDKRMRGENISPATLYDGIVKESFTRDRGKHTIEETHKLKILEDLAHTLWQKSAQRFDVSQLNQWLNDWFLSNPSIKQFYNLSEQKNKLYQDLRTATLLVRGDENYFAFSHRSMMEYFLARFLVRSLAEGKVQYWQNISASKETLNFVADILDSTTIEQNTQQGFLSLFSLEDETTKINAFQLWLKLPEKLLRPDTIDLSGCDLSNTAFSGTASKPLKLNKLNFSEAKLQNCSFNDAYLSDVNFNHSHLVGAEFHNCTLKKADFKAANLTRSIWRNTTLVESVFLNALLNASQWVDPQLKGTDLPDDDHNYSVADTAHPLAWLSDAQPQET